MNLNGEYTEKGIGRNKNGGSADMVGRTTISLKLYIANLYSLKKLIKKIYTNKGLMFHWIRSLTNKKQKRSWFSKNIDNSYKQ